MHPDYGTDPVHMPLTKSPFGSIRSATTQAALNNILSALKVRANIDFSEYKKGTLERRISKRMMVLNIGSPEEYARYLN